MKDIYIVSSRTDTTLIEPAAFTSYEAAYHFMKMEFENIRKELEYNIDSFIDEESAYISSDEYTEWRIDKSILDEYQNNAI